MNGLLDTHAFIWWDSEPAKLSAKARAFLLDPANTIWLSVVSVWELLIKHQLGKLSLRAPLANILTAQQANGIRILEVKLEHVLALENLPQHHRDPFDRLLIAQAQCEKTALLSADAVFSQYPVPIIW